MRALAILDERLHEITFDESDPYFLLEKINFILFGWQHNSRRDRIKKIFCFFFLKYGALLQRSHENKIFNFGIAKILATIEITEFDKIRLKFHRNFFKD
jgi:hypothetical protein